MGFRSPYLLAPLVLLAPSCSKDSSDRYASVDQPQVAPKAIASEAKEGEAKAGKPRIASKFEKMTPEHAAKCGRGTGMDESGTCHQLGLVDAGYVQRVQIPAGSFVMGLLPDAYDLRPSRETPAVRSSGQPPRVEEVDGFYIDLVEVTRRAYEACVAKGACTPAVCAGGADPLPEVSAETRATYPQTCVTHAQARAFCREHGGDLPTEAQWEYAGRGTDGRRFPWGMGIRDEIPLKMVPVAKARMDGSYFGILGLALNGLEWVADEYDPDAGLRAYLSGEFRSPTGPLARATDAYELRLACGEEVNRGCKPDPANRRFVIKSGRMGARRGAHGEIPAHPTDQTLEGWNHVGPHPEIGFRCATPLDPKRDKELRVPAPVPKLPLVRAEAGIELFGVVAEAVDRKEAVRFCENLRVEDGGTVKDDWRLPTLEEIRSIAGSFRGPGPFWAADGAVIQPSGPAPRPEDPWAVEEAKSSAALGARCVRTAG